MTAHIPAIRAKALRRALAAGGLAAALSAALPVTGAQATRSGPAVPAQGQSTVSRVPVLAFYYQWFSHSSWSRAKTDYPLIGTYSSSDPAVIRHQILQARSAGISGFIVSWKDTALNDQRLRLLMKVAGQEHFKLAMIYQGLDFSRHPLPLAEVAADFQTFASDYASSPVFYRLGGKPLTIWSGTWAYTHAQIAAVTSAVRGSMLVLATEKNVAGFRRVANVTDGDAYYWSSVNPATNTRLRGQAERDEPGRPPRRQVLDRPVRARLRRPACRRARGRPPQEWPDPAHRVRHCPRFIARCPRPHQLERVQRELLCRAIGQVPLPIT